MRSCAIVKQMANGKEERFPGIVYVIGFFGNLVKIGYTSDPKKRLRDICRVLAMARQQPVAYLAQRPGNRHIETLYHRYFKNLRVEGEWFSDDGSIVDKFNNAYPDILESYSPIVISKLKLDSRTDREVVIEIMERAKAAGSLRRLARQIGFSVAYLSQVTQGTRETSEKLAAILGYEKVITYRPKQ